MKRVSPLTARTVVKWLYGDAIDVGFRVYHIDVLTATLKDHRWF